MHTTSYWLTDPAGGDARACPSAWRSGATGWWRLSYTLGQLAALYLMCDRHDLGVALGDNGQGEAIVERGLQRLGPRPKRLRAMGGSVGGDGCTPALRDDYEPNIFIYDSTPGGIGLSEPLYRLHDRLLAESRALIAACACRDGCPSCVGPVGEVGSRGKEVALRHPRRDPGMTEPQRHRDTRGLELTARSSASRSLASRCALCLCGSSFLLDRRLTACGRSCWASPRTAACRTSAAPRSSACGPARIRRGGSGWPAWASSRARQRFLVDATPDLPSQIESLNAGRTARGPRAARGRDPAHPRPHRPLHGPHVSRARGASARAGCRSTRPRGWPRSCGRTVPGASSSPSATSSCARSSRDAPSPSPTGSRPPPSRCRTATSGATPWPSASKGPARELLYIPDIDKWEKWGRRLEDELAAVAVALLDGTFETETELPGRSLLEIPHPLVGETVGRLSGKTRADVRLHPPEPHQPAALRRNRAPRPRGARVPGGTGRRRDSAVTLAPRSAAAVASRGNRRHG